jgi:hypothetical protein
MPLTVLKISHLEQLNSEFFLAYMDVGASAIAGRESGVIDDIFSPQNRTLN